MRIIDFKDYKAFIRDLIAEMPKRGRGQYLKLSKILGIHTSMTSHIFKGDAHLTVEQALLVAEEFGLNSLERDYFVNMVQIERAGNLKTRDYFEAQLKEKKVRFLNMSERIQNKTVLDEKDQAIFYSQWYFLAVQILTAIDGFHSSKAIAAHLDMKIDKVTQILEFLVRTGLCTFDGSRYGLGTAKTYISRDSLLVDRHHTNWRLRTMQQFHSITEEELIYTCPAGISKKDFVIIREEIARLIEKFNQIVDPSPAEELVCLNIDWVKIRG